VRHLIGQLTDRYEEAFGSSLDPNNRPSAAQLRAAAVNIAARFTDDAGAKSYTGILREAILHTLCEAITWAGYDPEHAAQWTIGRLAQIFEAALPVGVDEQHVWSVVAAAYMELSEYTQCSVDITFFTDKTGLDIVDLAVAVHAAVSAGLLRRWVPRPEEPGEYYPALYELSPA